MNSWVNDIKEVVESYKPSRIVEVGSADGSISTAAILQGIRSSGHTPEFVACFEYKEHLWNQLKKLEGADWFKPLLSTSVKVDDWMTILDIHQFYSSYNVRNRPPINSVVSWYAEGVDHSANNPSIHRNGIQELVINQFGDYFDMILIDGGPFSADKEYELLKNSKIIILDDTQDIKCHRVFLSLLANPNYFVYKRNDDFCNGYCIFIKK